MSKNIDHSREADDNRGQNGNPLKSGSKWQKRIDALKSREDMLAMAEKGIFAIGEKAASVDVGIRSVRRKTMMRRMEDLKYTKEEVRDVFAVISAMTEDEIDYLLGDKDASVLEKVLARTYKEAIIYGSYKRIRDIIELFSGKAEVTTTSNVNHNFSMPSFKFAEDSPQVEDADDVIDITPEEETDDE